MKNDRTSKMKYIRGILCVFTAAAFCFFVLGQFLLPEENKVGGEEISYYEGTWSQEGAGISGVTLPYQFEVEQGEWGRLETKLPEDLQSTWLCFRSLQQEFKFYVDDELRKEYSTLETQLFGKTSTTTYVWLPLKSEDAGKTLRVDFMSDSFYTGYMESAMMGEKADIKGHLYVQYGPSAILAAFMVLISLIVIVFCHPKVGLFKGSRELYLLGIFILLASMWLLSESKLRQFFLPNSTVAMHMGFFMIMLIPYPFLAYWNEVQERRYEKLYASILVLAILNFVACTSLQLFRVLDFFESMTSSHIVLGLTIVSVLVTAGIDVKTGAVKKYKTIAWGLLGILLAAVLEIVFTYTVNAKLNGVPLCLALIAFLAVTGVRVGKEITRTESERRAALATTKSQAQFLANMSHEIRTPIHTMLGMNELIFRESGDKTIEGYSKHVKRAGNMLLGLIDDILDFSKIEAGKLEIVQAEYSLDSMLADVVLGVESRMKEKGLVFRAEVEAGLPSVLLGDELRIKQILNNLLSNALKYTEKGSVTLSVKGETVEEKFTLQIKVKDTGIGIKKEDIPHLFDSFQRLELEKNRHVQGTGLGLCITKQLVDAMEGTIEVASEYGEGTYFKIRLPQEVISMESAGFLQEEKAEEEDYLYAPDAVILAVDDNRVNLAVLKGLLKRSEIKIDLAMSGKQALELSAKKKYDLILMDHMMPEMDGVETLHLLRADKDNINCDTDVIVLTANAVAGAEQEYRKEGFSDYLAKPIDPEKAEKMLKRYLKHKGGEKGGQI